MRPLTKTLLLCATLSIALHSPAQSAWEKLKEAARHLPAAQGNNTPTSAPTYGPKPGSAAANQAFQPTPETGSPQLTASLAASAGFLDVTGIKLGMTVKDAMLALKAHNGLLTVNPETYVHGLIPNQTLVTGVHAKIPLVAGQIFESYEIAFSAQPSEGFVTAVSHNVHYPPGQQPSYESAMEGMRAKYGKESFVPRASATGPSYFWLFDLQGHPVNSPDVERIVQVCAGVFQAEEWQRGADIVTIGYEERKHAIGSLRCSNYAIVGVFFQGSLIPGQTSYLLDNLVVVASNGALYRSAAEATHAQYLAVQQKKDNDQMNNAQKQAVQY